MRVLRAACAASGASRRRSPSRRRPPTSSATPRCRSPSRAPRWSSSAATAKGLVALEQAAARNPDFAMVWHEAGYAAYRLGEHDRALLALDRAFALEPHSGTLHLRGKILRGAGRYLAAEVAFQGAAEAAEFPEQRAEAERQVAITRRYAAFSGRRPTELIASQRWFGDHGASLLTRADGEHHPSPERLVQEFITVAREEGWRFTHLVTTDEWDGWVALAAALSLPGHDGRALPPDAVPLVVGLRPGGRGLRVGAGGAGCRSKRGRPDLLRLPAGVGAGGRRGGDSRGVGPGACGPVRGRGVHPPPAGTAPRTSATGPAALNQSRGPAPGARPPVGRRRCPPPPRPPRGRASPRCDECRPRSAGTTPRTIADLVR